MGKTPHILKELRAGVATAIFCLTASPLAAAPPKPVPHAIKKPKPPQINPLPLPEIGTTIVIPEDPTIKALFDALVIAPQKPPAPDPAILALAKIVMEPRTFYDREAPFWQGEAGRLMSSLPSEDRHQVYFIDPLEFVDAQALGLSDGDYAFARVSEGEPHIDRFMVLRMMIEFWRSKNTTLQGEPLQQTSTSSRNVKIGNDGKTVCVVIPEFIVRDKESDIAGLGLNDNLRFGTYHEIYHCLHAAYSKNPSMTGPLKKETFADLGALGEMVLGGVRMDVFDKAIAWRKMYRDDPAHMTERGIIAMRDQLKTMGMHRFRAMTPAARIALYYKIADSSAVPEDVYKNAFLYTDAKAADRPALRAKAATDPAMRDALAWIDDSMPPPEAKGDPRILAKLKDFSPVQTLIAYALRHDKKITPQTLMRAHNDLQIQMMDHARRHPKDDTVAYKSARLLLAYGIVNDTDFVKLNQAYNVTLDAADITTIQSVQRLRRGDGMAGPGS